MLKFQALRKGGLVSLQAQPRLGAKKFVYVIGGSHRELGSAWTHSEFTYDSVEMFDIYNKCWHQVGNSNTTCKGPLRLQLLLCAAVCDDFILKDW